MLRHLPIICLTAGCLTAWAAGASVPKTGPQPIPETAPKVERVPVLVELFTSDSCTVCDAAGDLLRNLQQKQPIPGVEVIGIEMRMDAWSARGLRDPFALRTMTDRQNEYLRLFKLDSLLTPQIVIGGQVQLSEADAAQARDEIARAAKHQKALVEFTFQSPSVATVKVDKLPPLAQESEIWMAVTESPSDNASGTPLPAAGVVRSLVMLGLAEPGEPTTYSMHLRFNPRWHREDLKYVVFVQERASRKIWAATVVAP
jgi:hypothetical protein